MMVDNASEVTSKKTCRYAEYGSFEHLLFVLFSFVFIFFAQMLIRLIFPLNRFLEAILLF